ncbi:MAG TPA: hypothetical protein VH374_07390 [Polyangia bacterium]|jgi:hypothetical protein|nr:hypothetical protein [Polyangia bacterium]
MHRSRAKAGAALLALLMMVHFAPARAETGLPVRGEAKAHLDRGLRLYEAKQFVAAAAEFEATYALEAHRDVLYVWAQALRLGGQCAAAIGLYQKFLDADPPHREAERARANLVRCRADAAAAARSSPPSSAAASASPLTAPAEAAPPITATRAARPDAVGLSAVPPLRSADAGLSRAPAPQPTPLSPRLDRLSRVLFGGGAVALAVSGGFYLAARSARDSGRQATTYAAVEENANSARSRDRIAWGALTVGAALLVAGLVRFAWR